MLLATPFALVSLVAKRLTIISPPVSRVRVVFLNTGPCNAILVNVVPPAMRSTGFAINIFLIHALVRSWSPTDYRRSGRCSPAI